MKIQTLSYYVYENKFSNKRPRLGILLYITNEEDLIAWGEVSPLPGWSQESIEDCLKQIEKYKSKILQKNWTASSLLENLREFDLFPSVIFGLESALFSLLSPLSNYEIPVSALLMGSYEEILEQAEIRHQEGYTSAKVKISNLKPEKAFHLINQLKDFFHLRVDVNRAWQTKDSLQFFSRFSLDTFDYVEEPFQNPQDLHVFPHPLAVDESFPKDLSLEELNLLPNLKSLVYKPTLQGGIRHFLPLHEFASKKNISIVLSSSFESTLGLSHIISMAHRFSLSSPIGIGTYYHLQDQFAHFLKIEPFTRIKSAVGSTKKNLTARTRDNSFISRKTNIEY